MQAKTNQGIIIFLCALFILLVYLLSSILAPFLFGGLLAYLMDPVVKRLERSGLSHLLSVALVFTIMFSIFAALLLMIIPAIEVQIQALINVAPQVILWIQNEFIPWIREYINISTLKTTLANNIPKTSAVISTILSSGYAIAAWAVNLILIPVVTFYFLRDWGYLCHNIEKSLPKAIRPSIVQLTHEFDAVLSAFFRGQFLVMLALSFIYGIGLTLAGLQVGLMIGIIGGILSIVPYLGSGFVFVTATIVSLVQFGVGTTLYLSWAVFIFGQLCEGYVLTPHLVGNKIGLHPVVVIFSIMAGGALFGFFGVLVALPAAALIKVLLKFIDLKYELS